MVFTRLVLGQAHAPGADDALALDVDIGQLLDLRARHAGFLQQHVPAFGAQVLREGLEAAGVPGDEVASSRPAWPAASASSSRSTSAWPWP
jgi:hypothetical protein